MGDPAAPVAADVADVTVVIPAWNEGDNLDLLLPALKEVLADLGLRAQIVVADGGSTDRTAETALRWGARVVTQTEPGYGGALLAGFAAAVAPFVVTMDADLSHRPSFLEAFWRHRHDAEVLIASRYVPGGRADVGVVRRWLSIVLNRVYARALSTPLRDLSSGFRMYRRDVLGDLRFDSRGFDMLEEVLIRVDAEGWRIREIPFHYMSRGAGRSHVRLWRFGWAYLTTLASMWRFRNSVAAADYDYRAYDSPVWLQRYWQRTRHRIVLDFVGDREHVLDVGCGSSRIALDLPRAVGLDIRQNKLRWLSWRRSRRHPRARHTRLRPGAVAGARVDPLAHHAGWLRARAHHALHPADAGRPAGEPGLRGPRLPLRRGLRDDLQGPEALGRSRRPPHQRDRHRGRDAQQPRDRGRRPGGGGVKRRDA